MNRETLIAGIEGKLRSLRSCDTQASAIAWMSGAYKLMEQCLGQLRDLPPPDVQERIVVQARVVVREKLVYVPEKPTPQIVQNIPEAVKARNPAAWPGKAPTVVYPDVFLHPGLKPAPKAWTHADTLRLERAAKARGPDWRGLQRRGK